MLRRRLPGTRLTAVVCGLALAVGALVSASDVLADPTPTTLQAVHAHLAYRCRFPGGPGPAGVTLAGTLPAAVPASQRIELSGLRTTVTFPRSEVARLRRLGATAVTARDVLTATVADNANTVTALWPGRTRNPVPVPATDRLHLTFSGTVPPVTARKPGTVTFTAAGLSIALALRRATAAQANQAVQTATCTLAAGQGAKLATVLVTAAPARLSRPGHRDARHANGGATRGKIPKGCLKQIVHGGTSSPVLGCANLIGYADVNKLHEAGLVGRAPNGVPPAAFVNVDTYESDSSCIPPEKTIAKCLAHGTLWAYTCSAAQLNDHNLLQFPPAEATFLNFGFVPVTAVLVLSETPWPRNHPPTESPKCYRGFTHNKPVKLKNPIITILSKLKGNNTTTHPVFNTSETYLAIHVVQVKANGVPLPVGPNCGTAQPLHVVLRGHGTNSPYTGYTLNLGGPLTGTVKISEFEHCGVGENLNPLLNAGISGPANFQLITQGTLCTPQSTNLCPPSVPKPIHRLKS
jgi:hypothetical protein